MNLENIALCIERAPHLVLFILTPILLIAVIFCIIPSAGYLATTVSIKEKIPWGKFILSMILIITGGSIAIATTIIFSIAMDQINYQITTQIIWFVEMKSILLLFICRYRHKKFRTLMNPSI